MSRNKRLFLFAGYDKNGIINDALIYYVSTLSRYGDVIVCMDCDCQDLEIAKIKPHTIATIAKRHGEYDFGSYKRMYEYAYNNDLLKNYDVLYLVNDSVFGPMFDITPTLTNIENIPTDAAGLVISKHKTHSFMESWFVRINKSVFMSQWFYDFMMSVKHEEYKFEVTIKYEHGLTNVIRKNNCTCSGLYIVHGRKTYNQPKHMFICGCPFVKKLSFTRHNGALGGQIKYILKHGDQDAVSAIMKTAYSIYGKQYTDSFLTYNPIKIIWRNITYMIKKLKNGEI